MDFLKSSYFASLEIKPIDQILTFLYLNICASRKKTDTSIPLYQNLVSGELPVRPPARQHQGLSKEESELPVESFLLKQHSLLYRRLCGSVSIADFEKESVAIYADPEYVCGTDIIVDAERVVDFDFGFTEMREFVERARTRLVCRGEPMNIFFIGDRLMGRSIAKMYQSFSSIEESIITVHTEYDLDEAFAYLNIPSSVLQEIDVCHLDSSVECPKILNCKLLRCTAQPCFCARNRSRSPIHSEHGYGKEPGIEKVLDQGPSPQPTEPH